MTSPTLSETMRFISQIESRASARFRSAFEAFETARIASATRTAAITNELRKASAQQDDASRVLCATLAAEAVELARREGPKRRMIRVQDTTTEKLGELLSTNVNGILVCRGELSGLIAN